MKTCEDGDGHATVVTYTRRLRDWFRMRYWIRCFDCEHVEGPFTDEIECKARARQIDFAGQPRT